MNSQFLCVSSHQIHLRAAIGINHGLGEHIGRYDALANFFASNGFVVRGLDHEGEYFSRIVKN